MNGDHKSPESRSSGMFFFMPLQHSESLKIQEKSVSIYKALAESVPGYAARNFQMTTARNFAELHRDIIAEFGRFPHRNAYSGPRRTRAPKLLTCDGKCTVFRSVNGGDRVTACITRLTAQASRSSVACASRSAARIPQYARLSNQDMLTAVLRGHSSTATNCRVFSSAMCRPAPSSNIRATGIWRASAVLGSGLAPETPAYDLQRACGTSLEAAILIGNKIALGQIDAGIAGRHRQHQRHADRLPGRLPQMLLAVFAAAPGCDKIKPWLGLRPQHFVPELPGVAEPRTGLSMGQSTEITAKDWGITREAQDELAL